ncbi:predicted protein [Histoplasma mississippiense (nom. inval.)]|uniref:predicted protein n=1 Tax=Ajellomyces capsulatus (strain NAm1 / WU24) TaxID=2059318 RepID=UPI000157CEA2|nr:predicted protein [Histoplasma mississippiense (nom. inval.)]EDN10015.1 predicted protein [Histoplasma mississippiense (nom. inval.)]
MMPKPPARWAICRRIFETDDERWLLGDLRMPICHGVDIEGLSIPQLQQCLESRKFSVYDLTECYLERIRRINGVLKAVIEINPDALDIAARMDCERNQGKYHGPLHGIPFLVKDIMSTKDKMQTTAGSSVLKDILLEAVNAGTHIYNLAEHPGGSSCGNNDARRPAVESLALSQRFGLTNGKGVIPESRSLDSVGTLGKTVLDAAIALDGIVDSSAIPPCTPTVSGKETLRGAQFGLPWRGVWEKASQNEAARKHYQIFEQVIERIREAGANVIEYTDFPSAEEIIPPGGWDWDYPTKQGHPEQSQFTVVKTEFYNDLKAYLGNLASNPNNISCLDDIVKYNERHAETEGGRPGVHPAWPSGQDSFEMSLDTKGVMDDTYRHALAYIRRKSREEGIDAALSTKDGNQLDGLLVPLQADGGVACQVAAKAGYPMITIPVGIATGENDIPFGIGMIQTAWREDKLIRYGSVIEDLLALKAKPTFKNIDADNYMYIGTPAKS